MKKEFKLSDNLQASGILDVEDVKEFIKLLKDCGEPIMFSDIDELAGDLK